MRKINGKLEARKIDVARAVAGRKINETMRQLAARAGVGRSTLYRYLDEPNFRDVVRELTDARLCEWMPQIDRAMVKKAIGGSVGAATFIAQRAGRTEQGFRDRNFEDFLKNMDGQDRSELEYYMEHGCWPGEDGPPEAH